MLQTNLRPYTPKRSNLLWVGIRFPKSRPLVDSCCGQKPTYWGGPPHDKGSPPHLQAACLVKQKVKETCPRIKNEVRGHASLKHVFLGNQKQSATKPAPEQCFQVLSNKKACSSSDLDRHKASKHAQASARWLPSTPEQRFRAHCAKQLRPCNASEGSAEQSKLIPFLRMSTRAENSQCIYVYIDDTYYPMCISTSWAQLTG